MICYKFTQAQYAISTLKDRRIKVSRPDEFNDMFEFCPVSVKRSLVGAVMANEEKVRHLYGVELKNGYTKSFDYFKNYDLEQRLVANLPKVEIDDTDLNGRGEASKYVGVLCLCRCILVYLLWSHYADSHKGCAIGFPLFLSS